MNHDVTKVSSSGPAFFEWPAEMMDLVETTPFSIRGSGNGIRLAPRYKPATYAKKQA
jgi:hypothetical protein